MINGVMVVVSLRFLGLGLLTSLARVRMRHMWCFLKSKMR